DVKKSDYNGILVPLGAAQSLEWSLLGRRSGCCLVARVVAGELPLGAVVSRLVVWNFCGSI
ncbi:unnamed protein product, partial [Ilex paraguariensis]